jgi:hypothetical protein
VIPNVILHLINELPVVADLEDLPAGGDRSVRCTNIRTVDGKRPAFVHERNSTFIFPMSMIRLIEAPSAGSEASQEFEAQNGLTAIPEVTSPPPPPPLSLRLLSLRRRTGRSKSICGATGVRRVHRGTCHRGRW